MYSKYTGVILKKHPFGEADELLTIFTKETGKLRVKAVSSRKIQSRMAGHLQSLNEIEFEIASRRVSSSLPVLISVRSTTLNNYLRENLKKFAYALIGTETLYRLTADRQENEEAYRLLVEFLRVLGKSPEENFCLRKFQVSLLKIMGFGFDFEQVQLPSNSYDQLQALLQGQAERFLSREVEQTIDGFLHNVLEREIKAQRFLKEINTESNT